MERAAPALVSGEHRTKRYLFIDLYRSFVIFLMLEGHVFRAFLPSGIQHTPLFQLHEFFHGLSAPAFLFGAGLTFVISTRRRWEEYHHWDPPLARRVRRLLFVILLGLALHLPYFSIRKIIIEGTLNDFLQLFQFDVLHTIGVGLLSLHALIFFFKKESRFYALVLATIVSVVFLTPLVWDVDFLTFLPPVLAQMFNGNHGSPFPLFPYVGFLYAGVIFSWEFLVAADRQRERQFMMAAYILGAVLVLVGVVSDLVPVQVYPTYNFWFTSPSYFFIRAGALIIMVAFFWLIAEKISRPRKWMTVLGIESLFVYVLHLLILYGSAVNADVNLQKMFGMGLNFMQTTGVFVALLVVMLGAALVWNYLKERHFHVYRLVQLLVSGVFLYLFFTRDF